MKILYWNIGGKLSEKLQSSGNLYKAVALHEPDIICLQEHLQSAATCPVECLPPDYKCVAWAPAERLLDDRTGLRNETGRGSGGMVTYIAKSLIPHLTQ